MTDVVLESIPVLAVDLVKDENNTDPAVAKTATLQVDSFGAQKLALAQQLGVLTLALRNVSDTNTGGRGTVTGRDITASRLFVPDRNSAGARPMAARPVMAAYRPAGPAPAGKSLPPVPIGPTMTVVRGTKTSEASVYYGK
jgi:pilus assembly protein CpaB